MHAPKLESVRSRIETTIALARLLERVEHNPAGVGADQYRALIGQLKLALAEELPNDALQVVLGAHPETAEVYENMHYDRAGLSRSSLEQSIGSEMLASQILARIARESKPGP